MILHIIIIIHFVVEGGKGEGMLAIIATMSMFTVILNDFLQKK